MLVLYAVRDKLSQLSVACYPWPLSGGSRSAIILASQYDMHQDLPGMNNSSRERRSPLVCSPGQPIPRLYDRVVEVLRARHYSRRTEESYVHWIRPFTLFYARAHPRELGGGHVNTFLTHLAVKENVAASAQIQALAALLFVYRHVPEQPLKGIEGVTRARKPKELLAHLDGVPILVCMLLHGSGLRLFEGLQRRVNDLDFCRRSHVRSGMRK